VKFCAGEGGLKSWERKGGKWKDLPGYESTWEPLVTIKKQFPEFHLEDKVAVWEGQIDEAPSLEDNRLLLKISCSSSLLSSNTVHDRIDEAPSLEDNRMLLKMSCSSSSSLTSNIAIGITHAQPPFYVR
nr:Ty3/gypsy retrotransposon protein [Tanacetum cinerariifolium]